MREPVMNKKAVKLTARGLRLQFVQKAFDSGEIAEDEAREYLKGRLSTHKLESLVDDSMYLEVK